MCVHVEVKDVCACGGGRMCVHVEVEGCVCMWRWKVKDVCACGGEGCVCMWR